MNETTLNLARKWRSQNFDQIIGQDLSVRMLKNSLYRGHYFPVYLFSGQRGCGKTSMARIFAAALNCEQLPNFQEKPQNISIPCLTCTSCKAMMQGKHPDFIEIDAASHTGVDNVRSLVDAASLLPLMGGKKVYLIDEVHMLSKAAFNAFLKILEEPPSSVLFILATTDPQKIIETVKSRCFRLFFNPVEQSVLLVRLQQVCVAEEIQFDTHGLEVIVKETEGSVRDALNMLEQVRFASSAVTKESVLQVLGYIHDEQLIQIFTCILGKSPEELLQFISDIQFESYNPVFLWTRFLELSRALLWMKHGVEPAQFIQHNAVLKALAKHCSLKQLHDLLDSIYSNEPLFLKTTAQYSFLEMLLLQICQRNFDSDSGSNSGSSSASQQAAPVTQDGADDDLDQEDDDQDGDPGGEEDEEEQEDDEGVDGISCKTRWCRFVSKIEAMDDPLLNSIFKQSSFEAFDQSSARLDIAFSKDFVFFKEWLEESKSSWLLVLQEMFVDNVVFNPLFIKESVAPNNKRKVKDLPPLPTAEHKRDIGSTSIATKKNAVRSYNNSGRYVARRIKRNEVVIDVSDTAVWEKAQLVLRYFPGAVTEVNQRV